MCFLISQYTCGNENNNFVTHISKHREKCFNLNTEWMRKAKGKPNAPTVIQFLTRSQISHRLLDLAFDTWCHFSDATLMAHNEPCRICNLKTWMRSRSFLNVNTLTIKSKLYTINIRCLVSAGVAFINLQIFSDIIMCWDMFRDICRDIF